MKKHHLRVLSFFIMVVLLAVDVLPAHATTLSEIQDEISDIQKEKDKIKKEKADSQKQLNNMQGKISNLTGAMDTLDSEIDDLDAEMVGILTDIDLIEQAIVDKEKEIEETQVLYEDAVAEEERQYETMKIRIKYLYEKGDTSYVALLIESKNINDALNKADYVEQLYEYDRRLLVEYQETVQRVADLQAELEEQKSELETSQLELEEQKAILQQILEEKKQEYENYDVMLSKAKQEAAVFTAKINQQTNQIKELEAKERKKKEEEAAKKKEEEEKKKKAEEEKKAKEKKDSTSEDTVTTKKETTKTDTPAPAPSGGGGGKGQQIASYACQFIGNPYVAGGTSLTNGADCSGFTMSVFKNFGISLPRTSYAQSQVGKAVSYDQAKPGDLIYYGGHVAIYIGNGQIVHASTQKTGIKITAATYRPIVTIRRVV